MGVINFMGQIVIVAVNIRPEFIHFLCQTLNLNSERSLPNLPNLKRNQHTSQHEATTYSNTVPVYTSLDESWLGSCLRHNVRLFLCHVWSQSASCILSGLSTWLAWLCSLITNSVGQSCVTSTHLTGPHIAPLLVWLITSYSYHLEVLGSRSCLRGFSLFSFYQLYPHTTTPRINRNTKKKTSSQILLTLVTLGPSVLYCAPSTPNRYYLVSPESMVSYHYSPHTN